MRDPNTDLIGFSFLKADGLSWTVTGSSPFNSQYVNIENETGGVSCVLASYVRQVKAYADIPPGDIQVALL